MSRDRPSILHVIETLGHGGAERLMVTMLPALRELGCSVHVAALKAPLDLEAELREAGVPVSCLRPHKKWNLLAGARNVAQAARGADADIVHTHLFFPSVYAAFAKRLGWTKAKICVTYHNLAYAPGVNRAGLGLTLRKSINAAAARQMDARIAVSNAVAAHYRKALRCGPIEIVHNPIALDESDAVLTATPAAVERGPLHLVLPGRLVREKGHDLFVDALRLLDDRNLAFRATLAGDGPLREAITEQLRDAGLDARVRITGFLSYPEMLRTIGSADIVVIPSRHEGFGLTALEAMAVKRPVVSSDAGGLPEIVLHGETGLIFERGDAGALADAIIELAGDPAKRAAFGEAGRQRVERHFQVRPIANALLEIYRRLLAGSRNEGGHRVKV